MVYTLDSVTDLCGFLELVVILDCTFPSDNNQDAPVSELLRSSSYLLQILMYGDIRMTPIFV